MSTIYKCSASYLGPNSESFKPHPLTSVGFGLLVTHMSVTKVEEANTGIANFKHWFKTRSCPI